MWMRRFLLFSADKTTKLVPLVYSRQFVRVGKQIGVFFHLELPYSFLQNVTS